MGFLVRIWRLTGRRTLANWRLQTALGLGILVAATLLASAPIYSRAMADLGLTFLLNEEHNNQPNARIEFASVSLQSEDARTFREAVEQRITDRIGWFEESRFRTLVAGKFLVSRPGLTPEGDPPQGQLQAAQGYESRARPVAGRLPATTPPGAPIEVAMSRAGAEAVGLDIGDTFTFSEGFDTCERTAGDGNPLAPPPPPCESRGGLRFSFPAVVVGLVEPVDVNDRYWDFRADAYFDPFFIDHPGIGVTAPMFVNEETLLEGLSLLLPNYRARATYTVFVDAERVNRGNFQRAGADIRQLQDDLQPVGGLAFSPLTTTFDEYDRSNRQQQAPLTILLLEITAVALFYVLLVATVIVERQAGEITLLRSRGATRRQVAGVYLLEGATIGLPIVLVAPFLAAAATALVGYAPVFDKVNDGEALPVTITPLSFALAGLGALLSLAAIAIPAWIVAHRSAMGQRRAEARPRPSILQRYYLDVGLAAIAGLLLWELREKGSVFEPSSTGGVTSDPLLLASPALIIAAASALVLRFYPIALRLISRLVVAGAGVSVAVGMWQAVRSPGQYTRLALLLMMAVAVGTFAASYAQTAERSYRDRANFEAGVEWRVRSGGPGILGTGGKEADAELNAYDGVRTGTAVLRTEVTLSTAGTASRSMQLLAVSPPAAADLLWFRSDLADSSLDELMSQIGVVTELRGKPLPGDPAEIRIWVNTGEPREQVTLWARVRDSKDQYALVEFGTLGPQGWRELTANLAAANPKLVAPVTLASLVLTEPPNRFSGTTPLYFDDLSVVDAAGTQSLVDGFESAGTWAVRPSSTNTDELTFLPDQVHSGRSAARMTFKGGLSSDGLRGVYPTEGGVPIPVLASEDFLAVSGLVVGAVGHIRVGDTSVPIVVADKYERFPTLRTEDGPSVVTNRDLLYAWLNGSGSSNFPVLNEGWFELGPEADKDAIADAVNNPQFARPAISDRNALLDTVGRDPLISAGGSGILFLAFIALLFLVAVALLVSLAVAVQRRQAEFGILRALGVSRWQIFRELALEYSIVAAIGLVAGAYLGLLVGRRMLSFLEVTEDGKKVEPEFILQTDWTVVFAGAGVVLVVFLFALALAVRLVTRVTAAQALRLD